MMAKKWYKSRTIWINVLVSVTGIFTLLAEEIAMGAPLTIAGVLNIFLRAITKTKLE